VQETHDRKINEVKKVRRKKVKMQKPKLKE